MTLRLSTGFRNKMLGIATALLSNGTFDSDTTGWTAAGSTLASAAGGEDSTNCLRITNSGAAAGSAYQDISTRIGRIYLLSYSFQLGTGAAGGRIKIGTTSDDDAVFSSPDAHTDASWAQKKIAFVATSTTTRITLVNASTTSAETALFDNVECQELLEGLREIMRNARCAIYTGSQPTSADDAATGTLLVTIGKDNNASGVEWDQSASGTIAKPSADNWSGTAVATGTAGWFRFYEEGDTPGNSSTTAARFDGQVAVSGAQLNMSSTSIASGAVQTCSTFTVTMPAS